MNVNLYKIVGILKIFYAAFQETLPFMIYK